MKARAIVICSAAVALAGPAAAGARMLPAKHPADHAKRVVKHAVAPRILCICITTTGPAQPPETEAQWEAAYDQDLIAHGLDPVYGTTTAG
jgi:hypothetical protein